MGLTKIGWSLTLVVSLITAIANILLRIGIDRSGGFLFDSPIGLIRNFIRLLLNPVFTAGFFSYFFAALLWFRVIATEKLSIAYPILIGTTFILITIIPITLLKEQLSVLRLGGLLLIVIGITIVSIETSQ